jgi:protein O-mannosyl-transferase
VEVPVTRTLWIYLLLSAAILAVYAQVYRFEFVNFDDPEYVGGNNHVRAGLTLAGAVWAFTSTAAANWFPLTWISHMAAFQLFGMNPGCHHLLNVIIHLGASLLLFAALHRITAAIWRSAFVAFLFALHPLHVESVAWIAERKDVLCAFFWFLTLWCYVRYAEQPSRRRYALVLLAFCGGLMSKSMIVTLPFVLLLLDCWPLRRQRNAALLWEKLPLAALSIALSVLTFVSQRQGNAVRSLESLPFTERVANAVWTYFLYVWRTIWPAGLAVYYPYSHHRPAWQVGTAALLLAGFTWWILRRWRMQPYLTTGWLWYLGTLAPVIGLVQVGGQSSADRYTYVPSVGLAIMLSWGAAHLLKRRRPVLVVAAGTIAVIWVALTWVQIGYWSNSGTLFQHAVDVTQGNFVAQNNLANYYLTAQRLPDARGPVMEALRLNSNYPEAHINLATILRLNGQSAESEREYQTALRLQPANPDGHAGYGALLVREGRWRDAIREFSEVIQLRPESAEGHYNLGRVLGTLGQADQALAEFAKAVQLRPDYADAHHSLGLLLAGRGRMDEAVSEFGAEARLRPSDVSVHNNLAMMLAGAGHVDAAIAEYRRVLRLKPDDPVARRGLEALESRRK